jgi:hypothetical protein
LADVVLVRGDKQTLLELLKDFGKGADKGGSGGGIWKTAKKRVKNAVGFGDSYELTKEEAMLRDTQKSVSSVTDARFLEQLTTVTVDECLRDYIVEAQETAYAGLTTMIESLVTGIGSQIFSSQQIECDGQVRREVGSGEDGELRVFRSDFVRRIEDLSRERSRS